MTIRHMRIFLAICNHGCNLTRAAEALYMAQPAVSSALQELERYYGVLFFDRIGRRLYMTEAGRRFWQYASHIAALFDELEQGLRDWDAAGLLRVGASVTIATQLLPRYVQQFAQRYPALSVRVLIASSEQLEGKLLRSELDFALVEGVPRDVNIRGEPFMEDSLAIVCGPDSPLLQTGVLTAEELARQPLLLRERGSGTRETLERAAQAAGVSLHPSWEGMSNTALIHAAQYGLGVAVLARRVVAAQLLQGQLCELRVPQLDLHRQLRIIYHKDKFLTPSAKAFMALCKADAEPKPGERQP